MRWLPLCAALALSFPAAAQEEACALGQSSVRVLTDGNQFLSVTIKTIDGAHAYIDLEMFEMFNAELVGALAARARQIPVRVILDPFAGAVTPKRIMLRKRFLRELRAAGAEVAFYRTSRLHGGIFKIDHVKLLVADGAHAIVGGTNWFKNPDSVHDYNLSLAGPPAGRLDGFFAQSRAQANGLPEPPWPQPSLDPGRGIQILMTDARHHEPLDAILRQIRSAKKIRAEEYLLDAPRVVKALIAAQKNGADIKLLLDSNRFALGGVNAETAQRLLRAHIPVRFFHDPAGREKMLHATAAVFDDSAVILGSANWSRNALHVNHEIALFFRDPAAAGALERQFSSDWQGRSQEPRTSRGLAALLRLVVGAISGLFA